jgi:hypothetical protein
MIIYLNTSFVTERSSSLRDHESNRCNPALYELTSTGMSWKRDWGVDAK